MHRSLFPSPRDLPRKRERWVNVYHGNSPGRPRATREEAKEAFALGLKPLYRVRVIPKDPLKH